MNSASFLIRKFLYAYRDTKKILNYFNLVPINGFFVIPKLFLIRLLYSFSFIRNLIKIKIQSNHLFDGFFLENNISSQAITEFLDYNGHSQIFVIKKNTVDKIVDEIFLNKDIGYKKNNNVNIDSYNKNEGETLTSYFQRLKSNNISRVTGFVDLRNEGFIKSLLTSQPFISLASNYLNAENFSISASFFISNPIEITKEEQYANAQYFHWDNDFTKFLKFYIYLSDVDEHSGPHIFIPYTHKKKLLKHSLNKVYSDESIYNSYNKKIIFLGKSGSSFFTDGYGLHKAVTPTRNPRLLLNVHYGKNKILYSKKDIFYNT